MIKNLLIILVICFVLKAEAQNNDSIKLNRYYPEYYTAIKTGWNIELDSIAQLYWGISMTEREGIVLGVPEKIYYFPFVDTIPELRYYSIENISGRKNVFYGHHEIFVRDLTRDTLIEGALDLLTIHDLQNDPEDYYLSIQTRKFFNSDLNKRLRFALSKDPSKHYKRYCHNIFNYLDLPFKSGLYEIHLEFNNFESNHVKTKIIFADEQTLFYPESFNDLNLGYELDINSNCHPSLPLGKSGICIINIPSEIYHYPKTDSTTIIPLYSSACYSSKEELLNQGYIVEIFIKNMENNKLYEGKVDFAGRDPFGKLDPEYASPATKKERKEKAETFTDAQMCTRAFNINALDFVKMPFEAGNYEVYIKRAGYESNHMPVKIMFFE